jgi:hypothetical protein
MPVNPRRRSACSSFFHHVLGFSNLNFFVRGKTFSSHSAAEIVGHLLLAALSELIMSK